VTSRRPARRVNVWPAAQQDAQRLNDDDPRLGVEIAAIIRLLERGADGYDLQSMPKYGDLSDCKKWYFGIPGRPQNTHRLVYQENLDGSVEILEVVSIEERSDGYAYLLAANRLDRLPEETQPFFEKVHQEKIAKRSARRKPRDPKTGKS